MEPLTPIVGHSPSYGLAVDCQGSGTVTYTLTAAAQYESWSAPCPGQDDQVRVSLTRGTTAEVSVETQSAASKGEDQGISVGTVQLFTP